MQRVLIMSAKFAPGHFSHMLAYYKLFDSLQYRTELFLDKEYECMFKGRDDIKGIYITKKFDIKVDILLIYNLSIKDYVIIKELQKRNKNLKIIFIHHEPWFGYKIWIKNIFCRHESFKNNIKTIAKSFYARLILRKASIVFLPSKKAVEYYQDNCLKYNSKYILFPLIFTDEIIQKIDCKDKKYFSFISTASLEKNFEMYLEFVKYYSKKNADVLFQIVTRTNVMKYIDEELNKLIFSGRLKLICGHSLSNEEINEAYRGSLCTWLLYKRSTQSGVLIKSFMFGSPVIASNIGSFSEIIDGKNGIILKDNFKLEEIERSYEKIVRNIDSFTRKARETFLKIGYWENYSELLKDILQ